MSWLDWWMVFVVFPALFFFIISLFVLFLIKIEDVWNNYLDVKNYHLFKGVLNLGEDMIMLQKNDTAELVNFDVKMKWKPWPLPILYSRIKPKIISLNTLSSYLIKASLEKISEALRVGIKNNFKNSFLQTEETVSLDFINRLMEGIRDGLVDRIIKDKPRCVQNSVLQSKELLSSVMSKVLGNFKSEVVCGIGEILNSEVRKYKKHVTEELDSAFPFVADHELLVDKENFVYPHGTRFVLKRDDRTIFVIEEPPQIRTIFFEKNFLKLESIIEKQNFRLAFPYVVFVFICKKNYTPAMYMFYSKNSLVDLNSKLYKPNLPNVREYQGSNENDCVVCLGSHFVLNSGIKFTEPFWKQIETTIKYFWASEFNHELSTYYQAMKGVDFRFSSLGEWERHSKENPLFVLNVNWGESHHSLSGMLDGILKCFYLPEEQKISQLFKSIFEKNERDLLEKMQEFCESIKTENTYPKSIENEIIRHMRILAASSGAEILKSFSEIQKDNFSNGLFFNCSLEKVMGDILDKEVEEVKRNLNISSDMNFLDLVKKINNGALA